MGSTRKPLAYAVFRLGASRGQLPAPSSSRP